MLSCCYSNIHFPKNCITHSFYTLSVSYLPNSKYSTRLCQTFFSTNFRNKGGRSGLQDLSSELRNIPDHPSLAISNFTSGDRAKFHGGRIEKILNWPDDPRKLQPLKVGFSNHVFPLQTQCHSPKLIFAYLRSRTRMQKKTFTGWFNNQMPEKVSARQKPVFSTLGLQHR